MLFAAADRLTAPYKVRYKIGLYKLYGVAVRWLVGAHWHGYHSVKDRNLAEALA